MNGFEIAMQIALVILQFPINIWGFSFTPLQMFIALFFVGIAVKVIRFIFE